MIMPFNDIEHRINSTVRPGVLPARLYSAGSLPCLESIRALRDDNDDNDGDDDDSSDSDPAMCVAQVGWRRQLPSKGYNEALRYHSSDSCAVIPPDANLTSVVDVDVTLHFMPLRMGASGYFVWVENTDQSRRLSAVRARAVTLPTPHAPRRRPIPRTHSLSLSTKCSSSQNLRPSPAPRGIAG